MWDVIEDKPGCIDLYHKWVNQVKKTVPNDRLLVFSVKEGWEPLCKFLDKPVPDCPFPRINDTKSFQTTTNFITGIGFAVFIVPMALAAFDANYMF